MGETLVYIQVQFGVHSSYDRNLRSPLVACRERFHLRQWVVVADGGDQEILPGEVALKGFAALTCMLYEVSSRPHVNTRAFSPLLKHPPRHHLSSQGLDSFSDHVLFN